MRIVPVFSPMGAHVSNGSLAAAVTLTPPPGAEYIMLQAFTQNVRFTLDGTAPTATRGFQLAAGDSVTLPVTTALGLRVIEEAASATLQYQWGNASW